MAALQMDKCQKDPDAPRPAKEAHELALALAEILGQKKYKKDDDTLDWKSVVSVQKALNY